MEIVQENKPVIFVIDSEVNQSFLRKPISKIKVNSSHGDKVAAVIRSQTQSKIISLSAENFLGKITRDNYINALEKVKKYSKENPSKRIIVNISLGFSEKDFQKEIISKLNKENISIIAAAGNNNSEKRLYPAGFKNVISVAALAKNKKMSASNYGEYIDLSASGIIKLNKILYLPTVNLIKTTKITGTSFAAPKVTGLLAKMMTYNPDLSLEKGLQILKETSSKINDPLYSSNKLGAGKVNQFRSLSKASNLYLFGQIMVSVSALLFFSFFFIYLWERFSFGAVLIFSLTLLILLIFQPIFLVLYRRIGVKNITIIFIILIIFNYLFKKLVSYYLSQAKNIKIILFLSYFLRTNLKNKAINKIVSLINNQKSDEEKIIKTKLNKTLSLMRAKFYFKILLRIKQPPVSVLIQKNKKYNFSGMFIAAELDSVKRTKKAQSIIIGELIFNILDFDYKSSKIAADIALNYSNPIILSPIKKLLNKKDNFINNEQKLYFILEIIESFGKEAEDFSYILKNIILNSENEWFRYYALKAYLVIAEDDKGYREFLNYIKPREKEPVLLLFDNS